jgi:hypothetical protein
MPVVPISEYYIPRRFHRYSEECLGNTNQEMNWSLELSNIRNISKGIGKITILLGQLQMLKEHCSEMIINKTIQKEMR